MPVKIKRNWEIYFPPKAISPKWTRMRKAVDKHKKKDAQVYAVAKGKNKGKLFG